MLQTWFIRHRVFSAVLSKIHRQFIDLFTNRAEYWACSLSRTNYTWIKIPHHFTMTLMTSRRAIVESKDILALNLLRFRDDNNLSQEELAWKSGLSVKGYAQIERAEVQSSLKTLDKLSQGTGLSVLALLTHPSI